MTTLDPRLPLVQNADLDGKVVLVRFDHNVVEKGFVKTPTASTARSGRSTASSSAADVRPHDAHRGPRDKKTGAIRCAEAEAVDAIVVYLEQKLHARFCAAAARRRRPRHPRHRHLDQPRGARAARAGFGGIYLPNIRWFAGEEADGPARAAFARQLAGLADVFVNDAFGSWQPHCSTVDVTRHLPSFAGYLMQEEIANLGRVLEPERPFVAVVAGAKYDTKIGPLHEIYKKVDHLILGGVMYNAYLGAKYGVAIDGVAAAHVEAARQLVEMDRAEHKVVELPFVVESDLPDRRDAGCFRTRALADFKPGSGAHILDVDPLSFRDPKVAAALGQAKTIFVNAVMGFTPHFTEGSAALDETIDRNGAAMKLYGGGDTLQEFKNLCPGLYLSVMDNARYYFFTGGGTVLTAIEKGSPYGLAPVQALIANGGRAPA